MDVKTMKFIRTSQGLTATAFAQKVGVSNALISHIEGGERRLTKRVERKILTAFDITEEKLAAMKLLISII